MPRSRVCFQLQSQCGVPKARLTSVSILRCVSSVPEGPNVYRTRIRNRVEKLQRSAIFGIEVHCAPSELKDTLAYVNYKHLAALRPRHTCGPNFRDTTLDFGSTGNPGGFHWPNHPPNLS